MRRRMFVLSTVYTKHYKPWLFCLFITVNNLLSISIIVILVHSFTVDFILYIFMTERLWVDVLNFFDVKYCVYNFFSNEARSVFISWNVSWVCALLYVMLPVTHTYTHTRLLQLQCWVLSQCTTLCLQCTLQTDGWRQFMTTWTRGYVSIFHQTKLLHIPVAQFHSNNQLKCQREEFSLCVLDIFRFIFLCCNTICHI